MSVLPGSRTTSTSPRDARKDARAQALARVCAGFTTTISPQSAARLADLMTVTTYAKAA
ncbi:hypothetical protein [Streptomyces beijiangensis]|uniref:Uncharacterized protein n=1 Tax=Streptomyces beijiangensis TaxID=163361 RepID=A0A939F825_9ACTN|nr:hypothetical protein [Streptomyces beijiangensis]MBO0513384.1 hypothetical protein [Streptomyces beijiangensis]